MTFSVATARLHIREWGPGDLDAFTALATDPRVTRFISDGVPWPDGRIGEFFARQARHARDLGYCLGALCDSASGGVIGLAGLQPLGTSGEVEAGWWLAPDRWGQGLATEAGAALVAYALETLGLGRVVAITHPDNAASIAVMERIGMRFARRATGAELGLRDPAVAVVMYARSRST